MATKKLKGLGMGLEAVLGPKVQDNASSAPDENALPVALALDDLVAGQYQPRTHMDEGALYELAESIKAQGIMQPLLVRQLSEAQAQALQPARGAKPLYEIIAGERRFRAARLAGLEQVPVLVRNVPDQAAAAMALIENMQREDLNPLEEAQGLQRLIKEFGLTHETAAQCRQQPDAPLATGRAGASHADGRRSGHGPCTRFVGLGQSDTNICSQSDRR